MKLLELQVLFFSLAGTSVSTQRGQVPKAM